MDNILCASPGILPDYSVGNLPADIDTLDFERYLWVPCSVLLQMNQLMFRV